MTINIEHDAIVHVLDTARSSFPCHPYLHPLKPPSMSGLRGGAADHPPSMVPCVPEGRSPPDDYCPSLLSLDSDEDCISLSSCGSAASYSGRSTERRVSFAAPLVTAVKTRPRTKDCEKRLLFYTQSETDRFRQVYREERQSLSLNSAQSDSPYKEPPSSENSGRRRISRVVVEHNDSLETFYDFDDLTAFSVEGVASVNDVFFDNDSFWSGSITWY